MFILRLLLIVIVVVVVGAFVMGYVGGRGEYALGGPQSTDTSQAVARAREGGAELGAKAATAASKVEETLEEASLTAKIKAKMALDDGVKARAINVTTRGTTVTLSGVVGSKLEHDRAMALALETQGVSEVVDQLRMLQPVG